MAQSLSALITVFLDKPTILAIAAFGVPSPSSCLISFSYSSVRRMRVEYTRNGTGNFDRNGDLSPRFSSFEAKDIKVHTSTALLATAGRRRA